jgi:hypothetical protein
MESHLQHLAHEEQQVEHSNLSFSFCRPKDGGTKD